MKRILIFISCLFYFTIELLAIDFIENKQIGKIFEKNGFQGTIVIYDSEKNIYVGHDKARAEKRISPASTFKIYNSLIGLKVGAVKNVDEVFYKYNGEEVTLESWKKDSNLRYAIKVSQVPAYKLLARKIGIKNMQHELNLLNFGNKKIGDKIDEFWLKEPLKISPVEQTQLLAKLGKSELPYSKDIQKQVKDIILLEEGKDWKLYGKTGWAVVDTNPSLGWFVGFVEKNGKIYSFALNMNVTEWKDLGKRIEFTKESLKVLGII